MKQRKKGSGGARPGAGRPRKTKKGYIQIRLEENLLKLLRMRYENKALHKIFQNFASDLLRKEAENDNK